MTSNTWTSSKTGWTRQFNKTFRADVGPAPYDGLPPAFYIERGPYMWTVGTMAQTVLSGYAQMPDTAKRNATQAWKREGYKLNNPLDEVQDLTLGKVQEIRRDVRDLAEVLARADEEEINPEIPILD